MHPTDMPVHNLDSVDLALIQELSSDARQTADALSHKLGRSRSTIQGRVQRLLNEGIIRVVPISDPSAIGQEIGAMFGMQCLPNRVDAVADKLALQPNIDHVVVCGGRYNIMIAAGFEGPEVLSDFVRVQLGAIPGLTTVDTMMVLKMVKASFVALAPEEYRSLDVPRRLSLDALDRGLISELRHNGKSSQLELAAKLGTSAATVRRRMNRLLDNRIMKLVAIADPQVLGFRIRAAIGVNARHGRIDAVADELASFSNVHHLVICTGRYDIVSWAVFRGPSDFSRFVRNDLGKVRGIESHETMVTLRVAKEVYSIPGQDQDGAG